MQTVDEISEVINAIRQISGVGICYYDLENFFNYDKFGMKNNIGHYCRFCEKARGLKNGAEQSAPFLYLYNVTIWFEKGK